MLVFLLFFLTQLVWKLPVQKALSTTLNMKNIYELRREG